MTIRAVRGSFSATEEIMAIQECLNQLGYNAGTVDGIAGRNTGTALKTFLQDVQQYQNASASDGKFYENDTYANGRDMVANLRRLGSTADFQDKFSGKFDQAKFDAMVDALEELNQVNTIQGKKQDTYLASIYRPDQYADQPANRKITVSGPQHAEAEIQPPAQAEVTTQSAEEPPPPLGIPSSSAGEEELTGDPDSSLKTTALAGAGVVVTGLAAGETIRRSRNTRVARETAAENAAMTEKLRETGGASAPPGLEEEVDPDANKPRRGTIDTDTPESLERRVELARNSGAGIDLQDAPEAPRAPAVQAGEITSPPQDYEVSSKSPDMPDVPEKGWLSRVTKKVARLIPGVGQATTAIGGVGVVTALTAGNYAEASEEAAELVLPGGSEVVKTTITDRQYLTADHQTAEQLEQEQQMLLRRAGAAIPAEIDGRPAVEALRDPEIFEGTRAKFAQAGNRTGLIVLDSFAKLEEERRRAAGMADRAEAEMEQNDIAPAEDATPIKADPQLSKEFAAAREGRERPPGDSPADSPDMPELTGIFRRAEANTYYDNGKGPDSDKIGGEKPETELPSTPTAGLSLK